MDPETIRHAALWRRGGAALVDAVILALAVAALLPTAPGAASISSAVALVLGCALAMFYRMLFEGSRLAATPGKLLFGIHVIQKAGGRLSFATAALRGWPWWLPGAIVAISPSVIPVAALLSLVAILIIPISGTRQGLHDRMAGTYVVERNPEDAAPQP